ncbi:hypothetical protein K3U93_17970 [Mycobacterium malmoense]|uniref:hypothetical protein n=1 Tax=Mycobacterium malmoense TaxID=1780 RepID=UPI00111C143C|nr:hypothetical protein [Mycobacterium malmoense]QZA16536.1 hypothetical protein K3U93_17970 [Mycobacterium malmoense]UNB93337.1 hypothetical protein H5T25_17955 [Mycobacterium malmoense]
MDLAARPHKTTGVALATAGAAALGASLIALTPSVFNDVAVDIQHRLGNVQRYAVELADVVNPITNWIDTLTTATNSVSWLGQQMLNAPSPVLSQVLANQSGYGQTVVTSLESSASSIQNVLTTTLPSGLQTIWSDLMAGMPALASSEADYLVSTLIIQGGEPLFPILQIPADMTTNMTKALDAVTSITLLLHLVNALQGIPFAPWEQAGLSAQEFVDAVNGGDPATAWSTLINLPADITNAFLNGGPNNLDYNMFGWPGLVNAGVSRFSGELNGNSGIIPDLLLAVPRAIAEALGAKLPPLTEPPAAAAAIVPGLAVELPGLAADVGKAFDPAIVTDIAGALGPSLAADVTGGLGTAAATLTVDLSTIALNILSAL